MPYSQTERETIVQAVCERITQGQLTRESVEAEGISIPTFYDWMAKDAALAERYARARSIAADALAEQAVAIARDSSPETAASDRLAYDALRWLAGKRRPKDYGDRVEHEVSGTIGHLHLDALRAKPAISASANVLAPPIEAVEPESLPPASEPPPSA